MRGKGKSARFAYLPFLLGIYFRFRPIGPFVFMDFVQRDDSDTGNGGAMTRTTPLHEGLECWKPTSRHGSMLIYPNCLGEILINWKNRLGPAIAEFSNPISLGGGTGRRKGLKIS